MIPSAQDSWVVISSGRTGSMVIVDTIRGAYREHGIQLKYIPPDKPIDEKIPSGVIIHSHTPNVVFFSDTHTRVVISTRDVIEASLSFCIKPHIGSWHLYKNNISRYVELLDNITPFVLDPEIFIKVVRDTSSLNLEIAKCTTCEAVLIDYTNIDDICSLLGLSMHSKPDRLPIKNPGCPEKWILNWNEIKKICDGLRSKN
jgi:hypothetical protein